MSKHRAKAVPCDHPSELTAAFLKARSVLRAVAARIVSPQDIEDIVQETFVRSLEASGRRRIRHPRTYMVRVATNLALNHVSRAGYKLTDQMGDMAKIEVYLKTDTLQTEAESRERFLLFCRAARRMPIQCRRAFLLRKVYELSQKEIAEYLGISQSTVEKHVAKGMMVCSDYMDKVGYPVTKPRGRRARRIRKTRRAL